MKKFLSSVLNKIVAGFKWIFTPEGRRAAEARLQQAAALADKYYPLVSRIAAFTPTQFDDAIVLLADQCGVPEALHALAANADASTKAHGVVAAVIDHNEKLGSSSLVNLAIELAYNILKVNTPKAA